MSLFPSLRLFTLMILTVIATTGSAEIFQWTDADGNVHYSDQSPSDAAQEAVEFQEESYTERVIGETDKQAGDDSRVIMYATSWCGYCAKARDYFQQHAIPYTEHDIENDAQAREDYYNALNGRGVPVILVRDRRMDGFSASAFERIYYQ